METTTIIITAAVALLIGLAIGYLIAKSIVEKGKATQLIANAQKEAETIVKEAETKGDKIKSEKTYRAKEKFIELKSKHSRHDQAAGTKL